MDILPDRILIFDTGIGMDGTEENSIAKWYVIPIHLRVNFFVSPFQHTLLNLVVASSIIGIC